MDRYAVAVEVSTLNGSTNRETLYSFNCENEQDAILDFNAEMAKYLTISHRSSRLLSGGVFWRTAKLYKNGVLVK